MVAEANKWLAKAEEDIETAKYIFAGGRFPAAIFFCQQAAEKALKALLLERKKGLIKVHDIVLLAKEAKAPEEIIQHAKELTLAYTYSRYPDMPEIKDIQAKAKSFIAYADGVIIWVKREIS